MLSSVVVTVVLIVTLTLAIAGLRRPGYAVALTLSGLGLEQVLQANSPFFATNGYIWNAVTATVGGLALVASVLTGRYPFRGALQPAQAAVLLFLGFFVWSTQWSPIGDLEEMVTSSAPYMLVLVLMSPLLLQDPEDGAIALEVTSLVCAAICCYVALDASVWQETTSRLVLRNLGNERGSNPMALGDTGALAFIVLALRPGRTNFKSGLTWLTYPVMAVALYVAARASRGETVSAVVTVLTALFYERFADRRAKFGIGFFMLAALASAATALLIDSTASSRYESEVVQRDFDGRIGAVSALLRVYFSDPDSWFTGLGANYSLLVSNGYPHNQAVQALTETGIVGFALWSTAVVAAFHAAGRTVSMELDRREQFAATGFFAILVYFLGLSFKRGHVLDPYTFMAIVYAERFALSVRAAHAARLNRKFISATSGDAEAEPDSDVVPAAPKVSALSPVAGLRLRT